jgi:hypothetical protein
MMKLRIEYVRGFRLCSCVCVRGPAAVVGDVVGAAAHVVVGEGAGGRWDVGGHAAAQEEECEEAGVQHG